MHAANLLILTGKLGAAQVFRSADLASHSAVPIESARRQISRDVGCIDRIEDSLRHGPKRKPRQPGKHSLEKIVERHRPYDRPGQGRSTDKSLPCELDAGVGQRGVVESDDRDVEEVPDAGLLAERKQPASGTSSTSRSSDSTTPRCPTPASSSSRGATCPWIVLVLVGRTGDAVLLSSRENACPG